MPLTYHMTQALTGHGCFQHYLHQRGRDASSPCYHCDGESDTANHTTFECPQWSGHRGDLEVHLGHPPSFTDLSDIVCEPAFEGLTADMKHKKAILRDADKTFRTFYRMVEDVMTIKEEEEDVRARQAAEGR